MIIYINELGHMTHMAAMPMYGKNIQKCSPAPMTDDLETWYVTLSMHVLPRLFKL